MPEPNMWAPSGRLKATSGVSTGNMWDVGSTQEDDGVLGRLGTLAGFATSGQKGIKALTGYDINDLPGYLSTPIDILANPVGIASLLAAPFTGGASVAGLTAANVGRSVATRAAIDVGSALVGGKVGQIAAEGAANLGLPDWAQAGAGLVGGVAAGSLSAGALSRSLPRTLTQGKAGVKPTQPPRRPTDPLVLENSEFGVTKVQQLANLVKDATGKGVKAHPQLTTISDDMAATELQGVQQANQIKIKTIGTLAARDDVKYGDYAKGKAELINVGGTWEPLQHVARNPSKYALTPDQLENVIKPLGLEARSFQRMYNSLGGYMRVNGEVEQKGWFLPADGLEDGYPGAARPNKPEPIYANMLEGLANGKVYPPIEDAMHDYAAALSRAIAGRNAANRMMKIKDANGNFIFRTADQLVDPVVSKAYKAAQGTKYGIDHKMEELSQQLNDIELKRQEANNQYHVSSSQLAPPDSVTISLKDPNTRSRLLGNNVVTNNPVSTSAWIGPDGSTLSSRGATVFSVTDHEAIARLAGSNMTDMLQNGWIRRTGPGQYEVSDFTPETIKALDHAISQEAASLITSARTTGQSPKIIVEKLSKTDPEALADPQSDMPKYDQIELSPYADQRKVQLDGVRVPSVQNEMTKHLADRVTQLQDEGLAVKDILEQLEIDLPTHEGVLAGARAAYDEALAAVTKDPLTGTITEGALANVYRGRDEKIYGPRELTDVVNAQLNPQGLFAKASDVANGVNSPLRLFHTLLDVSDFGRLAGTTLPTHPFDFFKGIQTGFKSAFSRDALAKDFRSIDTELAASGIPFGIRDFVKFGNMTMGNPDIDLGILKKIPNKQAQTFIERTSNITQNGISSMRAHMIKTELLNLKQAGQVVNSDAVAKVVRGISLVTGTSIHRPVKGAGLFVQFPNWLQSQMEFIAHSGAGLLPGASYESKYAANAMIRMIGMGLTATYAVNAMGGHKTEFQDGVPMMRIGDMKIDVFGPYGALTRGMYAALAGDASALVRSRMSPVFQIGWDLGTGQTFTGDPAQWDDPMYWAKIASPYSLTSLSRDQGAEITLLQGAGVRATPVSSFKRLQEQAQEIMGTEWADLSGKQKEQLRAANPELVAQLDKVTKLKAEQGDSYAKAALATQDINDNLLDQQATLNKLWQSGQVSSIQLREGLGALTQAASAQKQQIRKDFGTDKATGATTKTQEALNQYFDLYTLSDRGILSGGPKTNIVDWDVFDRLETTLMSKLDPVQQKAIQDRYTVRSPELKWFYDNKELIRNSGYFETTQVVVDRMKTAIRAAVPGAESYSDLQEAYNKAQRDGNVGMSLRLLGLINRISSQVNPIHQQMTRKNPLLYKALVENGYVKQAKGRPLAANIQ